MTDLSKLAASLSDRQRDAILSACTTHPNVGGEPFVTVAFTDPWTVLGVAQFLTVDSDRLTPLGLQLRRYLQEMDRG